VTEPASVRSLESARDIGTGFVPTGPRVVLAILRRDAAEHRFLGLPFVLDFLFGVVNLMVFSLISRVLRHPTRPAFLHTASYFDFVAVGIGFMLVVQAASTQITSRIRQEQRDGTLELMTAQPVSAAAVAIGVSCYPILFGLVRAASYLGIAALLLGLDVSSTNWLGFAVVLSLGGCAALCFGMALAALTVAFEHGDALGTLLIVAVAFASGTYFPVAVLPRALRWLSTPLPTRIALDGLRAALSGGSWGGAAVVLASVSAVGLPLTGCFFGWATRLAMRRGTLTRG